MLAEKSPFKTEDAGPAPEIKKQYLRQLAFSDPKIAQQWHPSRNGGLTALDVTAASMRDVWWMCPKCGHEWRQSVRDRVLQRHCPSCAIETARKKSLWLHQSHPHLAAEWHPERNGKLAPRDVRPTSERKVWWVCEHGHEWQASVKDRTAGHGCPVCAGQRVEVGYNDLATVRPDLAGQWHPSRNGKLTPEMVTKGSGKKVWWTCPLCGFEWQATVAGRSAGHGCPQCANLGRSSLEAANPKLASEWHPTKNGDLTPGQIAQSSGKKVWWRCEHGHEWQATVNNRDHGHGCPVCSGRCFTRGESDLATLYPNLASEWHPTKNGKLTPSDVSAFSRRKVWWVCERGHEWQESVKDRARSKKCPICAKRKLKPGVNDLGTLRPDLASEWHPTKNGPYTPAGVKAGSCRVAWWTCSHCGHEWQATVLERQANARCPNCGG